MLISRVVPLLGLVLPRTVFSEITEFLTTNQLPISYQTICRP